MKVLCISSHLGSINNVRPEAEWFIGLARLGLDMTVMTEGTSCYVDRMRDAGVRVVDFAPRSKIDIAAIRTIRAELKAGQQDILHLFNNQSITNGILASLGLPVHVVTYRGQTGNVKRHDPMAYLKHLHPKVERITCVAEAVRADLIDNGVSPDKAVTVYKGHDLAWYDNTSRDDLSTLGIGADAFTIACVANNRPRKGVPVLIEATHNLPADSNIHIVLVGNGMTTQAIRDQVGRSPLAKNFRLLDYRSDVLKLIAACDATVLPATKREGLPKTVIESMALGVAPIVTRTGGSPELVEDGVSGYVVEPNDPQGLAQAMQRMAADRQMTRTMGAAARERLRTQFNLEQGVKAMQAVYDSLVNDG